MDLNISQSKLSWCKLIFCRRHKIFDLIFLGSKEGDIVGWPVGLCSPGSGPHCHLGDEIFLAYTLLLTVLLPVLTAVVNSTMYRDKDQRSKPSIQTPVSTISTSLICFSHSMLNLLAFSSASLCWHGKNRNGNRSFRMLNAWASDLKFFILFCRPYQGA